MGSLSGKALTDRAERDKKKKKKKKSGNVIRKRRVQTTDPFTALRLMRGQEAGEAPDADSDDAPAAADAAGGAAAGGAGGAAPVIAYKKRNFDESVDISIQLGIDPRKPDQNVRGVVSLPHGTGRATTVAVFAKGPKADEARAAGAQIVGAEDLLERIQEGRLDFNKCIATPDMMAVVGRAARILGPRGLMPNPKLGTLTPNVAEAVAAALKGQVEYRAEKRGIVSACVGKVSFGEAALVDNLRAFMVALSNSKPEAQKGQFLRHATMSTTMGRAVHIDMDYLDPSSRKFLRKPEGAAERAERLERVAAEAEAQAEAQAGRP